MTYIINKGGRGEVAELQSSLGVRVLSLNAVVDIRVYGNSVNLNS